MDFCSSAFNEKDFPHPNSVIPLSCDSMGVHCEVFLGVGRCKLLPQWNVVMVNHP
jgi:hypothetical protein